MFHANGGTGDTSYACNSLLQQKVISVTWPIAEEAITELCSHTDFPTTLTVADLGCSTGPNTLMVVSNLIKQVEEIRRKLHKNPLAYQIFLNDLHGNDFNTIFRSLPCFLENLRTQIGADFGPCFFNGVPGSFYARLFPNQTVHFFHSSNSLHWISRVPQGIENNKGNIYISSTSPNNVVEAYYRQFQKDFSMFLKYRSEELVTGGRMVLTLLGRTSEDPWSEECTSFWEFLTLALNSMVAEGIVEEEKLDSFNLPYYMPSQKELEGEVLKEGSFTINHFQVSRIKYLNIYYTEFRQPLMSQLGHNGHGYDFAKCLQSVIEPLFIHHFGEVIAEELFCRYKKIVAHRMSEEKIIECINLTISITKIK